MAKKTTTANIGDFMGTPTKKKRKYTKRTENTTSTKRKYTKRATAWPTVSIALPKDPQAAFNLGVLTAQLSNQ